MPTCPQCLGAFDDGTPVCPNDGTTLLGHDPAATLPVTAALALAARSGDSTDPLLGATLAGRYHVRCRIGQGGMGVVYEATHAVIGRPVAVKVLHERYLDKPEVAARLMNEARLASSIHNDHIVDIFDFGETSDGRTFVVMELLEGESLSQLLRREGPLPERRALGIGLQVCEALGAAHDRGILHRDVKPENVFVLGKDGVDFVKVLDFGISKAMRSIDGGEDPVRLTHTGMVLGTPLYMSPEQARGEEAIDHRIDVYALGVILYEALSGGVPFRGSNYLGIIAEVLSRTPTPLRQARPDLSISAAAEQIVLRAMAKERGERYGSMGELAEDVRRALAGEAVTPSPSVELLAKRAAGKRRALYAGIAAITSVVLAVTLALALRVGGSPMGKGAQGPAGTAPSVSAAIAPGAAGAAVVAPAPPGPPASPPPSDPVPTVEVLLESSPVLGAAVFDGARRLGATPLPWRLPRSDKPVPLTFRLDGYRDAHYDVVPSTDGEKFLIALERLPDVPAEVVAPARRSRRDLAGHRRVPKAGPDPAPVQKLRKIKPASQLPASP